MVDGNMMGRNAKSNLIRITLGTRKFLESLITNLNSKIFLKENRNLL